MTRILIVSDSFGNISKLDDIIRKYKGEYQIFVHLGNRCFDVLSLQDQINTKKILIRGNMELNDSRVKSLGAMEEIFEVEGIRILATHGHRYSVKSTMVFIKKEAEKKKADVVLFGHTGEKFLEFDEDVLYFNPGRLMDNDYGIIEIEDGEITGIEHAYLSDRW